MAATPQESVKMRNGLLLLFWICVVSVAVRVPLLCYELWLLVTEVTFSELTGWALLTDHLPFLSWIAALVTATLGTELGSSLLALPATLITVIKLIFSTLIGIWALDRVREMDSSHGSGRVVQSRS
jgi:hypothetical protein